MALAGAVFAVFFAAVAFAAVAFVAFAAFAGAAADSSAVTSAADSAEVSALGFGDLPVAFAATRANRLRPDRAGVDFASAECDAEPLASSAVAAAVRFAGFAVAWLALVAATYSLSVLRASAGRGRAPTDAISYGS